MCGAMMKRVILPTLISLLLVLDCRSQFDPQIRVLGNLVLAIGNHLFARFTDTEMPSGYENGNFMDQMGYIHEMLSRMRDFFLNPPEHLKDQLRSLTQSFSFQVQPQMPRLNITEKDLKEKFNLTEEDIPKYQSMANDCIVFVDEIIKTRGEEIPDKYDK